MKSRLTRGNLDQLNTLQRANLVGTKTKKDLVTVTRNTMSNYKDLDGRSTIQDLKSKITQSKSLEKIGRTKQRTAIIIPYTNIRESQRDQAITTQSVSGQLSPEFKRSTMENQKTLDPANPQTNQSTQGDPEDQQCTSDYYDEVEELENKYE